MTNSSLFEIVNAYQVRIITEEEYTSEVQKRKKIRTQKVIEISGDALGVRELKASKDKAI